MKISGAKQVHYESGPNMTPLVDVVMVILIFLMLAGSFGSAEHYMVSNTPIQAAGGGNQKPDPGWVPPTLIDVRIGARGEATLPGATTAIVDPDVVRRELAKLHAQFRAEGKDMKTVQVVLRPVDGTRWENLAPLYDAALGAKFEKVGVAMTGSSR